MKKETLYLISHGEYTSEISTMGAALTSLSFAGLDLIEKRTHPRYFSGEILAPWPNRIEDGKYSFRNLGYALPINEVSRNTALHGLVFDKAWQVISHEQDQVILGITIDDLKNHTRNILDGSYSLSNIPDTAFFEERLKLLKLLQRKQHLRCCFIVYFMHILNFNKSKC